jgi:hypothetical protein
MPKRRRRRPLASMAPSEPVFQGRPLDCSDPGEIAYASYSYDDTLYDDSYMHHLRARETNEGFEGFDELHTGADFPPGYGTSVPEHANTFGTVCFGWRSTSVAIHPLAHAGGGFCGPDGSDIDSGSDSDSDIDSGSDSDSDIGSSKPSVSSCMYMS